MMRTSKIVALGRESVAEEDYMAAGPGEPAAPTPGAGAVPGGTDASPTPQS